MNLSDLKQFIIFCTLAFLLPISCQRVADRIEPTLSYAVQDKYLQSLSSAFPALSQQERSEEWGKEMLIGQSFAHQLELYQAITAFKRAAILIPSHETSRSLEIQYEILLCYYIGKKYKDVIHTFETTNLRFVNESFSGLHDLLLILYDIYLQEQMSSQAEQIFSLIEHYFPQEAEQLKLSKALMEADFEQIDTFAKSSSRPYLDEFLTTYSLHKKSIGKAQLYNALLPGAGYLYLGQRQSATTSFFLNGLFIAASTLFFIDGNIPAGIIFTSFEAGWYFGGIYGVGLEAKAYNERLYEQLATPVMSRERLFPILRLNYAF